MEVKVQHLLKILESWEKAYLSPSATVAIKEAREMIRSLYRETEMLTSLVKEQKQKIEELSKEPRFPVERKKVLKNDRRKEPQDKSAQRGDSD